MIEPYYAVPDPADPSTMTYWRRDRRGRLVPWPPHARYGPAVTSADIPDHLSGQDRREWVNTWARTHLWPWHEAIRAAIDADPDGCSARFAAFTTRCCRCGRVLTDSESKTRGIGPECRRGLSEEFLAAMTAAVARAHAAQRCAAPPDPRGDHPCARSRSGSKTTEGTPSRSPKPT